MSEWGTDLPFAPVPMWVAELPVSDRALRLYTVLAGMRDYNTGQASYGRKLLAKKLRCSDDSLDRAKAELETHGAISVERGEAKGGAIPRNVYTIHRIPPGNRTGAGTPVAAPVRVVDSRTDAAMNENLLNENSPSARGKLPGTVAGVKVTAAEHELVDGIMAALNEVWGTKFAGAEWRKKIVRRVREHSDMDVSAHRAIIEHQTEHPWWDGDPSPSVIYGNGATFDRARNRVRGGKKEPDTPVYTKA